MTTNDAQYLQPHKFYRLFQVGVQAQGDGASVGDMPEQGFVGLRKIVGRHKEAYFDPLNAPGIGSHNFFHLGTGAVDTDAALADADGHGGQGAGGLGGGAEVGR